MTPVSRRTTIIVQSNTDSSPMMPIVLSDNRRAGHFPQPRVVIAAYGHEIRTVRTESAVPYPSLVVFKHGFTGKWDAVGNDVC